MKQASKAGVMHSALTLFLSRYPDQAPLETFFELLKKKNRQAKTRHLQGLPLRVFALGGQTGKFPCTGYTILFQGRVQVNARQLKVSVSARKAWLNRDSSAETQGFNLLLLETPFSPNFKSLLVGVFVFATTLPMNQKNTQ